MAHKAQPAPICHFMQINNVQNTVFDKLKRKMQKFYLVFLYFISILNTRLPFNTNIFFIIQLYSSAPPSKTKFISFN